MATELLGIGKKTHPIEFRTWCDMRNRCNRASHPGYKNYGGRGIKVCERWKVFTNFLSDVGERPEGKYTLGRIDNNGSYEPSNVRWKTWTEQGLNKRSPNAKPERDNVRRVTVSVSASVWDKILREAKKDCAQFGWDNPNISATICRMIAAYPEK